VGDFLTPFNKKENMAKKNETKAEDDDNVMIMAEEPKLDPSEADARQELEGSYKHDVDAKKALDKEIRQSKKIIDFEANEPTEVAPEDAHEVFRPGTFMLRPSQAKQTKIKVRPADFSADGKSRLIRAKFLMFLKGVKYKVSNGVYAANLRSNPNVIEVGG
jgi:hypothetical protein